MFAVFLETKQLHAQQFKYQFVIYNLMSEGSDYQMQEQDNSFNDHEDYIDGAQGTEQLSENHIDHYDESPQEYDDVDMSFEKDANLLTKVKAKIIFNLNKERQLEELPLLYEDITLSQIAMSYAADIKTSGNNEPYLKKKCEDFKNDADYKICELVSNYEEDLQVSKPYQEKFFVETSYLFLEMDRERELIMDPNNTNVGIGLAGNQSSIAIVLLVTQRELTILEIDENQHTRQIEVRGKMLDTSIGICGVKICTDQGDYKEIANALYDKIDFNRQTKEFCVYLDLQPAWKERRYIQLWTRENPDSIGYRKPRKEKDKGNSFRHLKMKMRSLFVLYPDKKYLQCYQDEVQAEQNRSLNLSNILLEPHKEEHSEQNRLQEVDEQQLQEEEEVDAEEEDEEEVKDQLLKQNMTSNKQIKEELQLAISQAKNTYDSLLDYNRMMQAKIKEIRDKNHIFIDKTNEASMNEHKYLNILAQVHQTRVQLQQTQNRYNKMSLELQNKLNEKQSKCNDIRSAFQELKRQVAKKATYSRSQQPIKQHKIEEWQDRQAKITEELQNLRLQILRARNTLSKNQKILKKKQELAEGLHLIDFQQLKIENQTLNQKIQERNEDLHKLKKKTTTMVQILTHTRQKLVFVQKMRIGLKANADALDTTIQGLRSEINTTKQSCEKLRLEIQDAKQETEIVNSQQLVVDFKRRAQNILRVEDEIKALIEKQKEMKTVIEMYQRKIRKQGLVK